MPLGTPISATYRLQFNKDFTFEQATRLLDYFHELGITHVYASPILRARRNSPHGYDVIDPTTLNPQLGTEADFDNLREELQKRDMGLILDIVPNHMSASSENTWWMDVLENGPDSAFASYFDVNWHPPARHLEGKILLPVLGRSFGEALEQQELKPVYLDGRLFVQYFELLFPLAARAYQRVLGRNLDKLRKQLSEASPTFQEYSGILAALATFAEPEPAKHAATGGSRPQFEAIRERLRSLVAASSDVRRFLDDNLTEVAGRQGEPASFSPLEQMLGEQFYLLAYWKNVNEEINYRRFFTIADLVGVRVEDPLVFEAIHPLVKRIVGQQDGMGLRVDHIDGLRDPLGYLGRLREQINTSPDAKGSETYPIYVEKILARDEQLPREWPVTGTTGYDFLNALNCFFVDPSGAKAVEEAYSRFLGKDLPYSDALYQKKKLVMATLFGVEMRSLGHQLELLAEDDRYARDLSKNDLTHALIETTAHLRVYRTYIRNLEVGSADKKVIEQALRDAQERKFYLSHETLSFVRDVLLLQNRPHLIPAQREARLSFVMRWQQFTGPIMAKAFEDTFLYTYNPLISLNEVGGDPLLAAAVSCAFADFVNTRARRWPLSLNAGTTHDTKRSEDVRARINVLSEMPDEWTKRLEGWSKFNARHKRTVNGQPVPDKNEEIFLYQTLLGAWPYDADEKDHFVQRFQDYAIKATREAMVHTRWTVPNLPHETALKRFITAILKNTPENAFLRDFSSFQQLVGYRGMVNGLSQTLLKIFSPGVPDFYQGSELWDFRLVDPDNRRPVDFVRRSAMLQEIRDRTGREITTFVDDLTRNWRDGKIKLYVIWKALNFRKQHERLFSHGEFVQLSAKCTRQEHVAAFLRRYKGDSAIAVHPRWLARCGEPALRASPDQFWGDTHIPIPSSLPDVWINLLTGEHIRLARNKKAHVLPVGVLLKRFPVALLEPARGAGKSPGSTDH